LSSLKTNETKAQSPDTTLCPQIEEAEQYVKNNNLGIWADERESKKH